RESILDQSGALLRSEWDESEKVIEFPLIKVIHSTEVENNKAHLRYTSLANRSFDRDYEAYMYYSLISKPLHERSLDDFLTFSFSQHQKVLELKEQVLISMD